MRKQKYSYDKPRKHYVLKLLLGSIVLILVGLGLFIGSMILSKQGATPTQQVSAGEVIPVIPTGVYSNVMFVGDIFWGRRMNSWAQASELKQAYPFSGLSDFNRESYDAWIGNMECPTDPSVQPTAYQEETLLQFNCSNTYLPELAKWFNIVSLANNHTDNQGASGFTATKEQLNTNNIQYFGHYDPAVTSDVCEVVSLPAHMTLSDASTKDFTLPVAMCGFHGVFKIPPDESLRIMQEYSAYMPVVAYPHMGVEYQDSADTLRTNLYRKMIDYGADVVLGNHPHWVQNSEAYKGKLIVYSMGNFIFDQQGEAELTRSAVISLKITSTEQVYSQLITSWSEFGDLCTTYQDSCLAIAKQKELSRLPLLFTYSISASDNSSKVTQKANDAITNSVIKRLNWNETAQGLIPAGITYP